MLVLCKQASQPFDARLYPRPEGRGFTLNSDKIDLDLAIVLKNCIWHEY